MVQGSCLCGGVSWRCEAPLELMSHCHCSICRKSHGAAFGTYVGCPAEGFSWLSGQELIRQYESSPGFFRPFCGRCGSVVAGQEDGGSQVFMPAGNLDGDPGVRPMAHIFVASKAPWYEISDELPRYDVYPKAMGTTDIERPARTSREGMVGGSCICGELSFEFPAGPDRIICCHCSRCRKARSAAHGTNLFVPAEGFRWISGEQNMNHFALPGAKVYSTHFCRTCGSSMPAQMGSELVAVPAGSLDDDPGARPSIHIFTASMASWFELADDLPRFEGRPGRS